MERTGARRVALTIVLSLVAAAIAVLNFGGGAIAQECGRDGSPSPSPSTTSPSPTDEGPLPTLPPLPGEEESESPTPSDSTTSTPTPGQGQQTIKCDSKITIRFADGRDRFSGAVRSEENACERGRRVILKKVKRGPDKTVGRTRTNPRGRWSIKEEGARGRYYAKTPKRNVDPAGAGPRFECGAAKSRTIRA
ncbi:MAG: hypothetical protein ACRDKT_10835 [Actinomycetota bacterium]